MHLPVRILQWVYELLVDSLLVLFAASVLTYTKQTHDLECEVPVSNADVVDGRGGLEAPHAERGIERRTPLDALGDAGRQLGGRLVQGTCNGLLLGGRGSVCAQLDKGQLRPDAPC